MTTLRVWPAVVVVILIALAAPARGAGSKAGDPISPGSLDLPGTNNPPTSHHTLQEWVLIGANARDCDLEDENNHMDWQATTWDISSGALSGVEVDPGGASATNKWNANAVGTYTLTVTFKDDRPGTDYDDDDKQATMTLYGFRVGIEMTSPYQLPKVSWDNESAQAKVKTLADEVEIGSWARVSDMAANAQQREAEDGPREDVSRVTWTTLVDPEPVKTAGIRGHAAWTVAASGSGVESWLAPPIRKRVRARSGSASAGGRFPSRSATPVRWPIPPARQPASASASTPKRMRPAGAPRLTPPHPAATPTPRTPRIAHDAPDVTSHTKPGATPKRAEFRGVAWSSAKVDADDDGIEEFSHGEARFVEDHPLQITWSIKDGVYSPPQP